MDRLSIDPDLLESISQGLGVSGEDLAGVWQAFREKVSSSAAEGAGGDELGGIIGEIHNVIVEIFDESVTSVIEEFSDAGADVQEWAAGHREADEAARAEFERTLGELGV